MAEIKRPNYFTSQFLVEKDFNDEQAYHLSSRRRHNRVLHTSGVVDGLDVTLVIGTQIRVGAGTAIDKEGRDIALVDPQVYTLSPHGIGGVDVYLTIAYQELFDPADQDTQEVNEFTRMTERPLLQDSTAVPPTDGSVIVLARIHLNSAGVIESNGIDTSVRTLGSAKVAPNAIDTTQLADGAVTLPKLANEVKPLSVQGATGTAITVVTDTLLRRITIGETHSARSDNPHGTTAAQIDNQGGANGLVTQINAGTGVITRSHVESAIASGVVTFESIPFNPTEVFSDEIDPGFGPGALSVESAIDDVPASVGSGQVAADGDVGYGRLIMFRSEVDRTTGRFRVFASRLNSGTGVGQVKVRWFASRPTAGPNASVAISVTVTPSSASLIKNATQVFTAKVNNTNSGNVTWSLLPPVPANGVGPGTLSNVTSTSATYTPPGISGTYTLVAASALDPNKTASVAISVNADLTVTVTPSSPTVFGGAAQSLSATVVNSTGSTGVAWNIREPGPGTGTLSASGNNATYTAPTSPGTYHVDAVSAADGNKKGTATITVPAVTISLNTTSAQVFRGETLGLTATVGNTGTTGVTWSTSGGSVSPTTGNSVTYTAPTTPGSYSVTAKSAADPAKTVTCTITVPDVTISVSADRTFIHPGDGASITATISGASNQQATWVLAGAGSLFPTTGAITGFGSIHSGTVRITGTAVADPSKSDFVDIDVQDGVIQ